MAASWNVGYVPQSHNMTCWAACVAMLVNFRDGTSYDDNAVAAAAGIDPAAGANDSDYPAILQRWGLHHVAGSCMTPEGWEELLSRAPTIVGLTGHVVVGAATNGEHDTSRFQAYILDPWPSNGPGWWSFSNLEQKFELRAGRDIHMIQP